MKVYVVGRSNGYANWLNATLAASIVEADLVLFTGGEDVSPLLYGEPTGKFTHFNFNRDAVERSAFNTAHLLKKPMLGICRGAQLLCVLAGGRLVQHQENNSYMHPILTEKGEELLISSMHHQAMFPYNLPEDSYEVLGWTENLSPYHLDGSNKEISPLPFKEVEIAFFPKINALGIQGHPEMMFHDNDKYSKTFTYLNSLVDKLVSK